MPSPFPSLSSSFIPPPLPAIHEYAKPKKEKEMMMNGDANPNLSAQNAAVLVVGGPKRKMKGETDGIDTNVARVGVHPQCLAIPSIRDDRCYAYDADNPGFYTDCPINNAQRRY